MASHDPDQDRARQKMCLSKIGYPKRKSAKDARQKYAKRLGDSGIQIYRCTFCTQFHLGHPPTRYDRLASQSRRKEQRVQAIQQEIQDR